MNFQIIKREYEDGIAQIQETMREKFRNRVNILVSRINAQGPLVISKLYTGMGSYSFESLDRDSTNILTDLEDEPTGRTTRVDDDENEIEYRADDNMKELFDIVRFTESEQSHWLNIGDMEF